MAKLVLIAAFALSATTAFAAPMAAVEIQFVSIGTGIDLATKTLVESKIRQADENNLIAKQTTNGWGLEGEVTICLQFAAPETHAQYLTEFKDLAEQGNSKIGFEATQVSEKDACLDD